DPNCDKSSCGDPTNDQSCCERCQTGFFNSNGTCKPIPVDAGVCSTGIQCSTEAFCKPGRCDNSNCCLECTYGIFNSPSPHCCLPPMPDAGTDLPVGMDLPQPPPDSGIDMFQGIDIVQGFDMPAGIDQFQGQDFMTGEPDFNSGFDMPPFCAG